MKTFSLVVSASALSIGLSAPVYADWFIRGTQNAWSADEMIDIGSNTVVADDVTFGASGAFKIDRFGDWSENYGVDGLFGGNIPATTGTVDIEFYTDTKDYAIVSSSTHDLSGPGGDKVYHLRGTPNAWFEGTLLNRVGTSKDYQACINFTGGDANGGPRFKIDPNGGWGSDAFPAADYAVSAGYARITVDGTTDTISSVEDGLGPNCGGTTDTVYHLRGTPNSWAEGTLFSQIGSTNDFEICVDFAGGDANGGPRFKVDPDGGWGSDAFPAVDVTVAFGHARVIIDSTTDSIKSIEDGLGPNCEGGPVAGDDFRNRTIYFLFLDRFANGDTSNDNGNNPGATSTAKAAGDLFDWKKYWGGDIQGLIDNLDYLEALGVSAVWVTPLNDNVDQTGNEGAYHGYWGRDFFEVDEHVGDWALVDQLDAALEARGMKLILDIALNHSNQDDQYEFGALYQEGTFLADKDNSVYYHQNGAIADCYDNDPSTTCNEEYDDRFATTNKTLFNLTDFNHGVNANSVVDDYLINAAKKWIDHGVDAFRIDAIKHIEPNFINRFTAEMRAYNPDVYIFGEWFDAGVGNADSLTFLNEGRGSELLDFKLRDAIENAVADDISMIDLNGLIEARAGAMNNREDWQPIFLDNHDATRTSVYLQTNGLVNKKRPGKGYSKGFADARQNLGMALVMTLPGIPTIYYGSEQNSTWFTANGDGEVGHDPYNREQIPSFSQTTAAFTMIKSLADLRKNSAAVARGSYVQKWVNADVLVFERIEGNDTVLVAVNKGPATTITVSTLGLADATYNSLVGNDTVTVVGGQAQLSLSQNEVIVLR